MNEDKMLSAESKTIKKRAIGTYILTSTLNVNGLNAPNKRHRLTEWIQKQKHIYVVYNRPTSGPGTHRD